MEQAVIVEAIRSPIGRIRGGLSSVRPDDLLGGVVRELVARTGLDGQHVGEVFAGCANQAGEDNRNVARMATLLAGLPDTVPAMTVNRLCASGLDAVIAGTRAIWVGDRDIVVAGGVESMSRAPYAIAKPARPFQSGNQVAYDTSLGWRFPNPVLAARFPLEAMGETAENIAEKFSISRDDQDRFALASHQKALAAWDSGSFDAEVVPTTTTTKRTTTTLERDEGPRSDTKAEKLAALNPIFRSGGTVTAGNSSTLNDGAAALMLMSATRAKALGMTPLARVIAVGSAGVAPQLMGLGPVAATEEALRRAGMTIADVELVELNEAFAVQSLAVIDQLGLEPERVNVCGGAIALGHPLGCSGARILTTLVHAMKREGRATGLATLCVGVGQGVSVLVEQVKD